MRFNSKNFFDRLKGKRVIVIGFAVSHRDLLFKLAENGASVTLADKKESFPDDVMQKFADHGIILQLGESYLDNLDADIIFRTPGMYFGHERLTDARSKGAVVTGEIEVYLEHTPSLTYAVTGSDGKTTSTTLISLFLKEEGKTVHLGGNIGRALLPTLPDVTPDDISVIELSSFQLMSMRTSPDIAVVTNVVPNHLDVHGTMDEYIDCKKNIFMHQNAFSRTVLNFDNDITRSFAPLVRGELSWFSLTGEVENGAFMDKNGDMYCVEQGVRTFIMNCSQIRLPGLHNVENYLTAIAATKGQVSADSIVKVAESFGGVEHRIEFVRELNGVKWYNDSIATSPTRVIAGLRSFERKINVIAGGYDKGIPFEPMVEDVLKRVKLLILVGATADKINKAITTHPHYSESGLKIVITGSLEEAVAYAYANTQRDDIVSLSPACASFDLYPNFEARGVHFKELVNKLGK